MHTYQHIAHEISSEVFELDAPQHAPAPANITRVMAAYMTDALGGDEERKLVLDMVFGVQSSSDMPYDTLTKLWLWLGRPAFVKDERDGSIQIAAENMQVYRLAAMIPDDFGAVRAAKRALRAEKRAQKTPKTRIKRGAAPVTTLDPGDFPFWGGDAAPTAVAVAPDGIDDAGIEADDILTQVEDDDLPKIEDIEAIDY